VVVAAALRMSLMLALFGSEVRCRALGCDVAPVL
jgi:hypothetical protein